MSTIETIACAIVFTVLMGGLCWLCLLGSVSLTPDQIQRIDAAERANFTGTP